VQPVAWPAGWALAWWGLVLYWAAAVLYLVQTTGLVRAARQAAGSAGSGAVLG
jgi:cardiolipin synthase